MADFDDELAPPTEPAGALVPPRRRPPVAIGTATPEPPPAHGASRAFAISAQYGLDGSGAPFARRIARRLLALLLLALAIACAWPLGWRARLAVALVALAGQLWRRADQRLDHSTRSEPLASNDRAA